jgi:hypothetical protein
MIVWNLLFKEGEKEEEEKKKTVYENHTVIYNGCVEFIICFKHYKNSLIRKTTYYIYMICTQLFLKLILKHSLRKNVTMHHTFLYTP